MRNPTSVLLTAALIPAVLILGGAAPSGAFAQGDRGESGKPERSLSCTRSEAPYCDVSCVTTNGEVLFVFDRIQAVLVTEFAGHHTLLELQQTSPADVKSILVGDISHCTFNGLQDPALADRR